MINCYNLVILTNSAIKFMRANLNNLANLFYKNVKVDDVLREAITNAIQANATNIKVKFRFEYQNNLAHGINDLGDLQELIIKDNGDGLTQENIDAFFELGADHKKDIGGKGIGRVAFLQAAKSIKIKSISKYNEDIAFNFSVDSKKEDVKKVQTSLQDSYTEIILSNLRLAKTDVKVSSCIDKVREKLGLMLFLMAQEQQKVITIDFLVNDALKDSIKGDELSYLEQLDYSNNDVKFKIYAFKNEQKSDVNIYYCADGVQVKSFYNVKNFNSQYVFAVTSVFFDYYVNSERTSFNFPRKQELKLSSIPTPNDNYQEELRQLCLEVIHKHEPNLKQENQIKLAKLKKDYGYINFDYLDNYVSDVNNLILEPKEIMAQHRQRENEKEEELIKLFNNPNSTPAQLAQKVSEQNKHELAKYIFHRDFIIKKGLELNNSKAKERELHELFFPLKVSSNSYNDSYQNGAWLLDDKFMSFVYVASDTTIREIITNVGENNGKHQDLTAEQKSNLIKRPDLFLLYNKPENSNEYKDAVLIEFKRGNLDYLHKTNGINQIDGYKVKLEEMVKNINNFYCYVVCDFESNDKDLERSMTNISFNKVFSNYGCMYYGYLKGSQAHVTFVSLSSILNDAKARNQKFLDILRSTTKQDQPF